MARDLSFWKYKNNNIYDDAKVYENLSAGKSLESVDVLPVNEIYNVIKKAFSEWNWINQKNFIKDEQMIEVYMTEQFFRFDCHNVTYECMNEIIDILNQYECPLYDAAILTRFEL